MYNYLVKEDYDINCSEVNSHLLEASHILLLKCSKEIFTKRFLTIHILPREIVFLGLGSPIDLLTKQYRLITAVNYRTLIVYCLVHFLFTLINLMQLLKLYRVLQLIIPMLPAVK